MATSRLLGRTTAATGAIEEISIGSGLSFAAGVLGLVGGGTGVTGERPITVPTAASFTLENAGTASLSDITSGLQLDSPSATANIRFARYNGGPPATPYQMIVRAPYSRAATTTSAYNRALILRNSSNGRLMIFGAYSTGWAGQTWSSYTAFNGNMTGSPSFNDTLFTLLNAHLWWRLRNDGTTVFFEWSPEGYIWNTITSEALASYLTAAGGTADQIGIGNMVSGAAATDVFQSFEFA